jgi:hypothetical protein
MSRHPPVTANLSELTRSEELREMGKADAAKLEAMLDWGRMIGMWGLMLWEEIKGSVRGRSLRDVVLSLRYPQEREARFAKGVFNNTTQPAITSDAERWHTTVRERVASWAAETGNRAVREVLTTEVAEGRVLLTAEGLDMKRVVVSADALRCGDLDLVTDTLSVRIGGQRAVYGHLQVFDAGATAGAIQVEASEGASALASTVPKPVPAVPGDAKPLAELPPPTTGRPRLRRDRVVSVAKALHEVLRQYPDHAVPMKIRGKEGKMQAVPSGFEDCDFLHMRVTQGELWARLPPETQALFGSERKFREDVAGPGGVPREGHRVSLDDQDVLKDLRYGFRKKAVGMQSKGIMHVGGGVKGDKGEAPFPRLYWADLRDGRAED